MTQPETQQKQSIKFFVAIFTAIITALFISILGYNSWLTQRSLSTTVSQPIEHLTSQIQTLTTSVQNLNDKLTRLELRTTTRLIAVEKDVADTREDMTELKGRVMRLEETM
ncbi:hypothetical protein [Desulfoluna spongiiphila]|uniref:Uncharacterized protein n=1 Tax=Desulfoluna spongiiphila TaxID=419481 RepID=A0A1G5G1A4_9BACT|nr:hypothetical protein [Desulfoluna spongiiphila]SCY44960.1 hypothetical protein SAMN05216233_109122 [Desulfoluna spongiiphila]